MQMKKRIEVPTTLWITLFSFFLFSPYFSEASQVLIEGRVTAQSDGDTVRVTPTRGGAAIKVRLVGMDTPETHLSVGGKTYSQGYWGEMATAELNKIIPVGTKVSVLSFGLDDYGRHLGDILLNGKDVNLQMVQSGWALLYMICSKEDCTADYFKRHHVKEYVESCIKARKEGKGNFVPSKLLPELPFEFRKRIEEKPYSRFVADLTTKLYYEPGQHKKVDLCQRLFFTTKEEAERLGFKFSGRSSIHHD